MLKKVFLSLVCLGVLLAKAQSPVSTKVIELENLKNSQEFKLFTSLGARLSSDFIQSRNLKKANYLLLSTDELQRLQNSKAELINFELSLDNGQKIELSLMRNTIFSNNFKVSLAQGKINKSDLDLGIHYRGYVKGHPDFLATISVFKNEIRGIISTDEGNLNLIKLPNRSEYILYNDLDFLRKPTTDACKVIELPGQQQLKGYSDPANQASSVKKCVNVYIEADYEVYQVYNNSTANVTSFLTALFNEVAAMYTNENITVLISEIFVWNVKSPYSGNNSGDYLTSFAKYRKTFNGNVAHLVNLHNYGGVAYLNGLCLNSAAYGYSGIYTSFDSVPNYSWSVEVMTHELGHNFGSPHTHSCTWAGGPIDNCYPVDDGPCKAGPKPVNGGTVMSYCHLNSNGINFNKGFGPLPGARIRDFVGSAFCLSICGTYLPPTNDNCDKAIALTPHTSCSFVDASAAGASLSAESTPCSGDNDDDVWFTFVANSPKYHIVAKGMYDYDAVIELRANSCTGSSLACGDYTGDGAADSIVATNLVPGTTYYVRVFHFMSGFASGDFKICVWEDKCMPPPKPTINKSGNTLTATGIGNFQWINTANSIVVSTQPVFTPTVSGTYAVRLTDASGCQIESDPFVFTVSMSLNKLPLKGDIVAYPNPFERNLALKFTLNENASLTITAFNVMGQKIKELATKQNLHSGSHSFIFDPETAGIYYICIEDTAGNSIKKKVLKY